MTIEIPDNYYSLKAKIEYLRSRKPIVEFPEPPRLPRVGVTIQDSAEEVETYARLLLDYAKLKRKFLLDYEIANTAYEVARPQNKAIEEQVLELIYEDVGLTKFEFPEKKVARLWQKAWDDSTNEEEAIGNLREFVGLFED